MTRVVMAMHVQALTSLLLSDSCTDRCASKCWDRTACAAMYWGQSLVTHLACNSCTVTCTCWYKHLMLGNSSKNKRSLFWGLHILHMILTCMCVRCTQNTICRLLPCCEIWNVHLMADAGFPWAVGPGGCGVASRHAYKGPLQPLLHGLLCCIMRACIAWRG